MAWSGKGGGGWQGSWQHHWQGPWQQGGWEAGGYSPQQVGCDPRQNPQQAKGAWWPAPGAEQGFPYQQQHQQQCWQPQGGMASWQGPQWQGVPGYQGMPPQGSSGHWDPRGLQSWQPPGGPGARDDADAAREQSLLQAVTSLCSQQRFREAHASFLEMRELWHSAQQRFAARGLNFESFNAPYQQAYRCLRRLAQQLAPAAPRHLPERERVELGERGEALRLMTFNVLSEHLNDLFSFQFVVLPEGCGDFLSWDVREAMLEQEISRWRPDIVCFQEIDRALEARFGAVLARCGLQATPVTRRSGTSKDGLCFAYNPEVLRPTGSQMDLPPPRGGNTLVAGVFEVVDKARPSCLGKKLGCATTQVMGREPACSADVMAQLLDSLATVDCDLRVLAGDLNGCGPGAAETAEERGYCSAYGLAGEKAMAAGGPVVTAHNDEYHWCGELDLVLFESARGRAAGVIQIPHMERLVPQRSRTHPAESMPAPNWPSDHMSLVADLVILDS